MRKKENANFLNARIKYCLEKPVTLSRKFKLKLIIKHANIAVVFWTQIKPGDNKVPELKTFNLNQIYREKSPI